MLEVRAVVPATTIRDRGGAARLVSLAALLVASVTAPLLGGCGDEDPVVYDELPASFRLDAEIVSVTGDTVADCTPNVKVSGAPDWSLQFDQVQDPLEPTFAEITASSDPDSAAICDRDGDPDCCAALADVDGGWILECDGTDDGPDARNKFVFTFAIDGSGTATTTRTSKASGLPLCTAVTEWSKIIVPAPES